MSISVQWQCKAYTKENNADESVSYEQQPPSLVEGEALKRVQKLNVFEPATHQIGDRSFYTLKERDVIMMRADWRRLERESLLPEEKKSRQRRKRQQHQLPPPKRPAAPGELSVVDDLGGFDASLSRAFSRFFDVSSFFFTIP